MSERNPPGGSPGQGAGGNQPFVSEGVRPDVRIDPERPITELRVRELSSILGQAIIKKYELKEPIKEFKDHKIEKWELKYEIKEIKLEKFEKHEKIEIDPVQKWRDFDPDPGPIRDPRLEQIIQVVAGLQQQVARLADQVQRLEERVK